MSKMPLVLLPGLLCDATVWRHQMANLKDIVDIIIPDLNQATTPDEMVLAVLDVAPPLFALAGHSMGGWVALEVMKRAPERVIALGLLNTTAKPDSDLKKAAREKMIKQVEQGEIDLVIDELLNKFVYVKSCIPTVRQMFKKNQHAFINQEEAMLKRDSCVPGLSLIACPTLIIHSTHDAVFSLTDSQLLSEQILDAKLDIIHAGGHMSPLEADFQVTRLMREWIILAVGRY